MKPHRHNKKHNFDGMKRTLLKSRGDTLIEILITFFVISVGVLGASSMQIVALQNVNGSSYRDQAVIVAENLSEGIRAAVAANSNISINNPAALTTNLPSGNLAVTLATDSNTIDLLTLRTNLQITRLPASNFNVNDNGTNTTTDNATITIIVRWDEDRSGSNLTNCPVVSSNDLDCYQITFTP